MSNRYWNTYFVQPDQTMKDAKDNELENYLRGKGLNSEKVIGHFESICKGHDGNPAMFFANTRVETFLVNGKFGNKDVTVNVYGNRGMAAVDRKTSYASFYFDDDLVGPHFFSNIFNGRYLSVREGSELEDVTEVMNKKKRQFTNKQEIVCRIVERLWYYQEKDDRSCLVLYIGERESESCSLDWLNEVYHFIPQQLRARVGFVTNSTPQDIIFVRNKISVALATTMSPPSNWKNIDNEIHCIDLNQVESGNEARVEQLKQLYQMYLNNSVLFEAKLAYAEVVNGSSFEKMQDIVNMMLGEKSAFWWEDESISGINALNQKAGLEAQYINSGKLKEETIQILRKEIAHVLCKRITTEPMCTEICQSTTSYTFLKKLDGVGSILDIVKKTREKTDSTYKVKYSEINEKYEKKENEYNKLVEYKERLEEKNNEFVSENASLMQEKESKEAENERLQKDLEKSNNELCDEKNKKEELQKDIQIYEAASKKIKALYDKISEHPEEGTREGEIKTDSETEKSNRPKRKGVFVNLLRKSGEIKNTDSRILEVKNGEEGADIEIDNINAWITSIEERIDKLNETINKKDGIIRARNEEIDRLEQKMKQKKPSSSNPIAGRENSHFDNRIKIVEMVVLGILIVVLVMFCMQFMELNTKLNSMSLQETNRSEEEKDDWTSITEFYTNINEQINSVQGNLQDMQQEVEKLHEKVYSVGMDVSELLKKEKQFLVNNNEQLENTEESGETDIHMNDVNYGNAQNEGNSIETKDSYAVDNDIRGW